MAMARSKDVGGAARNKLAVVDVKLQTSFPCLHEFLTEIVWEDGKARKTGTMMIVVEDGYWKMWLHDRDGLVSSWTAGTTVDDVMLMAEDALERQTMQWRPDKPSYKRN
jgi:hypothetical protein